MPTRTVYLQEEINRWFTDNGINVSKFLQERAKREMDGDVVFLSKKIEETKSELETLEKKRDSLLGRKKREEELEMKKREEKQPFIQQAIEKVSHNKHLLHNFSRHGDDYIPYFLDEGMKITGNEFRKMVEKHKGGKK